MLSGSPDNVKESILQQDAETRDTEVPVGNEYVIPSSALEEESKEE